MNDDALAAHLRLMASLPVRTVKERTLPITNAASGKRSLADTKAMHEKIMALVAQGKRNHEIADELRIPPMTVGRHRRGIYKGTKNEHVHAGKVHDQNRSENR